MGEEKGKNEFLSLVYKGLGMTNEEKKIFKKYSLPILEALNNKTLAWQSLYCVIIINNSIFPII